MKFEYREGVSFSYTKMYKARDANNPLMLVYTIDKDSEVWASKTRREKSCLEMSKKNITSLVWQ